MGKTLAIALMFTYLAVTPLCLANIGHPAHVHSIHEGMHMTMEHTAVPLSYHTGVYQTFTTAFFTVLLLLFGAVVASVITPISLPVVASRGTRVRRVDDPPPDPLSQRLSLLIHAPPQCA